MKKFINIIILIEFIFSSKIFSITSTSTIAGSYVRHSPILVIDDFDDGVPPNNLGGGAGSFASISPNGFAKDLIISTNTLGSSGSSLEISYDVTNTNSYAGYWTKMHHSYTRDFSSYRYLSFYVKGQVGGEFFKVELSTGPGGWKSRVYINDYLDGGVTTEWQKVVIPFDSFCNITDWKNIYELTFVFEQWACFLNGSPYIGKIYVDNIVVGTDFQGFVRIDHFGDALDVNSLGGNIGDVSGGGGSCSHSYPTLEYYGFRRSIEINYNVSPVYSFAGVFSVVGGTTTGWGKYPQDFSKYNQISFYIKAKQDDKNPGSMKVELKDPNTRSKWITGITTNWQKYIIPLSDFTGLDKTKIQEIVFVFDWSHSIPSKIGTVYIDKIQFEDSTFLADNTPPTSPTNLQLKNSAVPINIVNGTKFGWINWICCTADNAIQDPTLEQVRFEYRETGGSNWKLIGADYNLSDNIYCTFWDTTGLSQLPQTYEIRAVARDTSGNESYSPIITNLEIVHYPNIDSMTDDELLEFLQKQFYWYFMKECNPDKGIVQDRAKNYDIDNYGHTSVAATGIGLIASCIAYERGWLSFSDAYNYVSKTLQTYFNAPESSNPSDPMLVHKNGFYYHYTNFGGARTDSGSELSTIDTTIFLLGAFYAGQFFKEIGYNTPWNFAEQLYKRVDWNWMRGGDKYLEWGWTPEGGFNQGEMSGFSECILSYILGYGSPEITKKLTDINDYFELSRPTTNYKGLYYIFEKALFTHQYPQLFINFDRKKDNFYSPQMNTFLATIHHQKYCYDNRFTYKTYNENSWGLGGADGVDGVYHHYGVGIPGTDNDGTIAISNLLSTIMQTPKETINAIKYLYNNFKTSIWGKYAFSDSYNTDDKWSANFNTQNLWRSNDVIGVQLGAALLAIENYRTGNIRRRISDVQYVKNGLTVLGFNDDTISPAAINSLSGSASNGNIILSWIATGNNDYSGNISTGVYEIRIATDSAQTWDSAPSLYFYYDLIWSTRVISGQYQTRIIEGLPGETTYYIWIKLADDNFNWSSVSNKVTVYLEDKIPPAKVNDLSGSGGLITVLNWTATGDDGVLNNITNGKYRIEYTTVPTNNWGDLSNYFIEWSTNIVAGSGQSISFERLITPASYYFWIKTADEVSNWSELSNKTTVWVYYDITPPAKVTTLQAFPTIIDGQIKLVWRSPGDDNFDESLKVGSKFKIQYSTWTNYTDIKWSTSNAQISVSTHSVLPNTEVSYNIDGLNVNLTYYFRIWYADEVENWSDLSNVATGQVLPWFVWDDCDSRFYIAPSDWGSPPIVSWTEFGGRKALSAKFPAGSSGRWGAITIYDRFKPENWSFPIVGLRAHIYVNRPSTRAKVEIVRHAENTAITLNYINLIDGIWNNCSYAFLSHERSSIARIHIIFENVGAAETQFYVDNLRLVREVGDHVYEDIEWDDMDDMSRKWDYKNNAVLWPMAGTWSERRELITGEDGCPASPAASLFMAWDNSITGTKQARVVTTTNFNEDWSTYKSIKAWIKCSSTINDIKIIIKDNIDREVITSAKRVTLANNWQVIAWNIPSRIDFNWNSVKTLEFLVITEPGAPTGTIYIDNISLSNIIIE